MFESYLRSHWSVWRSPFAVQGAQFTVWRSPLTPPNFKHRTPNPEPGTLPPLVLPPLQFPFKGVDCAKCHFCSKVDVSNARLKLQEILPGTFFVSLGVLFVAHLLH